LDATQPGCNRQRRRTRFLTDQWIFNLLCKLNHSESLTFLPGKRVLWTWFEQMVNGLGIST
jgi:hypothetical protein